MQPTKCSIYITQACKKPNATDKMFCESVDATHRRNDFSLEPRAAGHRELRTTEAFVVRDYAHA